MVDILRRCTDSDLMEHFTVENIGAEAVKARSHRDLYHDTGSIKMSKTHALILLHALIALLVRHGDHWDLTSEMMLTARGTYKHGGWEGAVCVEQKTGVGER